MRTARPTDEVSEPLLTELFTTSGHPDPYPLYRRLRELAPLHETAGRFVALSYAVADAVLRHPAMVSGAGFTDEHLATPMWRSASRWIMYQDGERHRLTRSLLTKAFTPRTVENLRPYVGSLVETYLDDVAGSGELELVTSLAFPLPIRVIGELIGIPEQDRGLFRDWSREMLAVVADAAPDPATVHAADVATLESEAYLAALLQERRRAPRDDLVSRLATVEDEGRRLTDEDIVSNLNVLVGAGFETTVFMIGNAVLALLDHPDQLGYLREHPDRTGPVVEELLRYEAPVLSPNPRVATEEVTLGGCRVPAGASVIAWPGAANRDPRHVEDPERLDLRRSNPRPLSFGSGFHYCAGALLARMEIQECLGRFLRRFDHIERVDDGVDWVPSFLFRGPQTLRLRTR